MNTANLQLQGLYIVIASLCSVLVTKGLLSRQEVDAALASAEASSLEYRPSEGGGSNREAVAFPARLLRRANQDTGNGELPSFSKLARMVAELEELPADTPVRSESVGVPGLGELTFYTSENGDRWALVTDAGGRQFVRHSPAVPSGGEAQTTDLQAFREREPHSAQNQRLEERLRRLA
jgi:hypothetical protein